MSNKTVSTEVMHVLIVGAGISGLCLAQGLKKNGISFSIFDSEPSANAYRPREWTMSIHWSLPILETILPSFLYQKLESAQPDPAFIASPSDRMTFYNGKTGELLKELPTGGMRRYSRRKLRNICSTNIEIVYAKTLVDILYDENGTGVTACFSDGSQFVGTTLVGCDGPRSTTRQCLLRSPIADINPSGFILLSTITSYSANLSAIIRSSSGVFRSAFHPNCTYYVIFPQDLSSPNPEEWMWQLMHSSAPRHLLSASFADRLAYLKTEARSSDLTEPFKSAVEEIPEGTVVFCDELGYWEPTGFDSRNGRVTILGDASHPMTPQRGQGLNHAICDVGNLVKALCDVRDGAKTLNEAVESYGTEMVARGSEEVKAALLNTQMVHDFDRLMESPLMKMSVERGK